MRALPSASGGRREVDSSAVNRAGGPIQSARNHGPNCTFIALTRPHAPPDPQARFPRATSARNSCLGLLLLRVCAALVGPSHRLSCRRPQRLGLTPGSSARLDFFLISCPRSAARIIGCSRSPPVVESQKSNPTSAELGLFTVQPSICDSSAASGPASNFWPAITRPGPAARSPA